MECHLPSHPEEVLKLGQGFTLVTSTGTDAGDPGPISDQVSHMGYTQSNPLWGVTKAEERICLNWPCFRYLWLWYLHQYFIEHCWGIL